MPNPDGTPTLEEIREERARRQQAGRSLRTQAAAGGQPVSVEAIRAERERRRTQPQRREPVSTGEDVVRSFASAIPRGVQGLVALPRTIDELSANWARDNNVFGNSRLGVGARELLFGSPYDDDAEGTIQLPSYDAIERNVTTPLVGAPYEPQTTAGEYARTAGEFAPTAAFPWAAGARISRTLVPAIASETAGQATEGTDAEPWARFLGGFAGGVANEAALAQRSANFRRLGQPAPESEALEAEFGPLTRGERTGRPQQRLQEDDLRRGMGSNQAQSTMRTFDARRAQEIRDNAMNVVTRGQQPLSQDVGEAGVILGDELRTARQALRDRASAQYERAFEAARNEPIPAGTNRTPSSHVAEVADEFGFEVPPAAQRAIGNLERQIQEGTATHANVERARQALNRELGAASNARNDAQEFVYSRIVGALDDWQESALTNPQARQAMQEARGIYAESQNLFAQRTRTDLTTGQTGRMDPGGRAIDRTINTDLTGEQIIDGILGTGRRPPAQALGAVRRIKELGTNTIIYTNRNAESGVRVPGRGRVGGRTAGQRRFDADNPDAAPSRQNPRGGMEQPTRELQALREGMWHRLLSPLDDYLARVETTGGEGGFLPAQRMVSQLDNALNGSGREITQTLYTAREIEAMQRLLRYFKRIVPPAGANYSGTAAALYRQISGALDSAINILPGLGQVVAALRKVGRDFSSTLRAENAVARPPARSAPRPPPAIAPPEASSGAPAVQAALALPPPEEPRRLGLPAR